MFSSLSDKFFSVFSKLAGKKTLTPENIQEAVNDVRLALLEADAQYGIVKKFIKGVKEKAAGLELIKNVKPAEQFAKIVHDELVSLMGSEEEGIHFKKRPASLMLAGLQGAGKTTSAVKLALYAKKKGSHLNPCVVACDLQRPGAVDQLETLASEGGVSSFSVPGMKDPREVAKRALAAAKIEKWDLLIFDTAGRLHVDDELMQELSDMQAITQPEEILYVANAALGQDAVRSAHLFSEQIELTGTILTMLDGSQRAGASLSIREVTGKPLKFESVGERPEDFQLFNPTSMADRILGMGDTINLVRKAEEHIKEEDAKALEEKMRTASFTFEDFLTQSKMIKKMGSMKSLFSMMPGFSALKNVDVDDKEIKKFEAIILSMTFKERKMKCELSITRRKRIARGSGTTFDEVNKMIKSFKKMKELFKNFSGNKSLKKMVGGLLWR